MISEALDYSDVLLVPKKGILDSRAKADLFTTVYTKHSKSVIYSIPIIVSNMDTVGTLEMLSAVNKFGIYTALHKHYTIEDLKDIKFNRYYISFGLDITIDEIKRKLENNYNACIMLDVANGYIPSFLKKCEEIRKVFPNRIIAAGNIATPDIIADYDSAGVDIVKVGIGPGGQCLTRTVTGVGIPQFTAVQECSEEADRLGLKIIADGGINEYGDFAKAFGAGADFVMSGSMFAGTEESSSKLVLDIKPDRSLYFYKEVYGMASAKAMEKYDTYDRTPEGRISRVEYIGSVKHLLENIFGALRSTITYCGVTSLYELQTNAKFVKVTNTINRKYENNVS